jgi:carbohydrate-binding DOMON domain-containing protein
LSSSLPQSCPFVHLSQRKAAKTKPQKNKPTQTQTQHITLDKTTKETTFLKFCFCKQFFVHFNHSHIISLKYLHLPPYSGIDLPTMI